MILVAWISTALAALDAALAGVPANLPPPRIPVVLVHGIHSDARDLTRLAAYLRREGHETLIFEYRPSNGQLPLDQAAQQLAAFIEKQRLPPKFDLVGFSMGGLISRHYMQRLGGVERVEHFVTLAAPHQGTVLAGVNRRPGVIQMRRGSDFLRDLERDVDCLKSVKFTSFYTPLDLIIVPARSSEMPQARNVRIWAAIHPSLILERRCLRAVAAALAE